MSTLVLPLSVVIAALVLLAPTGGPASPQHSPAKLTPTAHAALPDSPSALWLVPSEGDGDTRSTSRFETLADAAKRYREGDFEGALEAASNPALLKTSLAGYARYYKGLAQLRLSRAEDARRTFEELRGSKPGGYLATAAALGAGEAAEAAADHAAALRIYQQIAADKQLVNDEVLTRVARTAEAAGDRKAAAEAYVRLYYEHALTPAGLAAGKKLEALKDLIDRSSWEADLGRAQMLFGARRYTDARAAFAAVRPHVRGDDRELADLRIAECDFQLKKYAAARDGLRPYLDKASRKAEARFFYLSAIRELGDHAQYVSLARALVNEFPDSSWAEETLNNLGTHYILVNEDPQAAEVFRELYARYPTSTHAPRAAWKYGWWSYKTGNYAETIRVFESAAAAFPRTDYRPSFIYWAARAHTRKGDPKQGTARMRLVYADYAHSYYGRLAEGHLRKARALPQANDAVRTAAQSADPAPALANETTIRQLLAAGLYDDAIEELRYAQRVHGTAPAIEATIAWAYNQKGELRRGITLMRRAYPQFMADGGDQLPAEIRKVIFPLSYWSAIRREANARQLDPYLIAALIAQESTFEPKARSVANAWGLMQIVPATGRRIARQLGIRNFQTSHLTNPDTNIRIGTHYFSRLVQQFGGTYYALASYNAGENRVVRWKAERPGIDQDEFIDDIPFPETQNYVKRILGTAEDYRLLYGGK